MKRDYYSHWTARSIGQRALGAIQARRLLVIADDSSFTLQETTTFLWHEQNHKGNVLRLFLVTQVGT